MGEDKDREYLDMVGKWKSESDDVRSVYDDRWSKNLKLLKGVPSEGEGLSSKVRKNRSKLFFRKIWATGQRMVASFYGVFLRDQETFRVEGRDTMNDPKKAKVLHKMVEYRRDVLYRKHSLFLKMIWAFMDIVNLGWAVGKMDWVTNDTMDEPIFTLYPPEQVYPDLSAETIEDMDYVIFENYMTMDAMEEMDYDNLSEAQPESIPSSSVRSSRSYGQRDPLQNPKDSEYPSPGRYDGENIKDAPRKRYRVWEIFYKKDGEIMFSVTNTTHCILKKEVPSKFGDRYPVVMGLCLTEAHKLLGEGLPEPLEGPQKSLNTNLNQRKDNVSLVLNRETFVSRYGNVDLQSLTNSRPGGITLMDDVSAVKERDIQDVTRSAYLEAAADESMMQEMSGITAGKMGMEGDVKATVANINYAEANAKIDMYAAIVGETFVKSFFSLLAYMIQRFETDEKVFRIANAHLQTEHPGSEFIYDLDFEADVVVNIGLGNVGKEMAIRQTMLAIDRANMANQSSLQLLQIGAAPPGGVQMINTAQFFVDLLPDLGKRDLSAYFYNLPPPQQGWPQGGNQGMRGKAQPQSGGLDNGAEGGAFAV